MSEYDHMMRGGKTGSGPMADHIQSNVDRRERLRKLAMETIDLSKDEFFMRNHLGQMECKLCLTLHPTEGSYLAHTQGKRHQENIGRRAAREAQRLNTAPTLTIKKPTRPKAPRIGRPGYRVTKQYDAETGSRSLLFQVEYPQIGSDLQPRHRFMSAYEQKIEAPDRNFQYLLVAAEPYETIGFKIPSLEIDRGEGKFFSHWDREKFVLTLQMHFKKPSGVSGENSEM